MLGTIYEQYLGTILKGTEKRVKLDEGAGKRKKMGIYYTPSYIVDYIVKNTVGEHIKDKTIDKILEVKILDPACGSGSFLIRAFQEVYEAIENRLKKGERSEKSHSFRDYNGRLNLSQKITILINCIYGVDLDEKAVELAQLNLLLRLLEDETRETKKRLLPPMKDNIKCGNSLIDDLAISDKAFNWQAQFPDIFSQGGFDVVIENPPYIRIQTLPKEEVAYFNSKFESAKGNYDIYLLFMEQAYKLSRRGGVAGFILPNKFMVSGYGENLRELLSCERVVWKIVDFGDAQVFEEATTYTMLLFLQKLQNRDVLYLSAAEYLKQNQRPNLDELKKQFVEISYDKLTAKPWSFAISKHSELLEKIEGGNMRFGDLTERMFQGLVTSADKVYILQKTDEQVKDKNLISLYSVALDKNVLFEKKIAHLKGSLDIRRYRIESVSRFVLFPYKNGQLISQEVFESHYPKCWKYLFENKEALSGRENGKMKHAGWYGYVYPKSLTLFEKPKLLTPSIAKQASFTYDKEGEYYFVGSGGGGGGGYGILLKEDLKLSPLYILALLNSRLLDFYLQNISSQFRHGYFAYNKQYVEEIPIKLLDLSKADEKSKHDQLISLVDRMLSLQKKYHSEKLAGREKELLEQQIKQIDWQIDQEVYKIYGITEEEKKIIEERLE